MAIYKFGEGDVLRNRVKTYPSYKFFIYEDEIYSSQHQPSSSLGIYSFLNKDSSRTSFNSVTVNSFDSNFLFGDEMTAESMSFVTASITMTRFDENESRDKIDALKNTLNYKKHLSPHYSFSSSLGEKSTQELMLLEIPSLIKGSKIKKRSIKLEAFITGTLIGRLEDINGSGELIQTNIGSSESGSVAGVVLYEEGFIVLTGSWDLSEEDVTYNSGGTAKGNWSHFGLSDNSDPQKMSYVMHMSGTQTTPTVTMFCHALEGELNYSSNPTFIKKGQLKSGNSWALTSSNSYVERENLQLKNLNSLDYSEPTGSFEKITYITGIRIYDENMNVIGVAKMARPVKKRENDSYTFKTKLDI